MAIRINNIILGIDDDIDLLKDKAAKKLRINKNDFKSFKILRESVDARKRDTIRFNYTVEVNCQNESKVVSRAKDADIRLEKELNKENFKFGTQKLSYRPIIVGMGPAGMFAGLLMAERGYNPIIIERGERVEDRTETVNHFWSTGKLNLDSNVQFGEGGAGTFSDGKLTTRVKDSRCDFVLERFVKAGASEEILYSGKPHIGTDVLKNVVKSIRNEIVRLGGEVMFQSKMEDIIVKNGKVQSVIVNGSEIPCDVLIMSIGHSARDTYEMLQRRGVQMVPKPFSIGVRIEHLQRLIDENQYGKYAGHKKLKAADYRLTYTCEKSKRAVYSFCMCPGGEVVAAASEDGRLVTNGMSYYARNNVNANAAIVVSVGPEDFEGSSALSGMEFQRHYEQLAYSLGGGGYIAPVQLVGDFLQDKVSSNIGSVKPSYRPGYEFRDMRKCLPNYVVDSLKEGFINFDKKIKGFAEPDAVITGIETRTSAPLRIERNDTMQSINTLGLYPAGEGAGYAGGIVSAAVDGIRVAEEVMKNYSPIY